MLIFALMKRHALIGFLLLVALSACHSPQREARRMVARAERLFDTLPDSTASLIDSVLRMPVYFNEKRRMDMALLQAEALLGDRGQEIPPLMDDDFFDDKPFFSTSPELERAAEYYAKKKKYAKAAHAALYSGFVQQHYNDKAAAMLSFKEAEHYGRLAGDSLAVARAEYRMGKMLYYDGMNQEALTILKDSEQNFGKHLVERALSLNIMSICHLMFGDYNNAEICLQQSLMYAEYEHVDKVKRKVLNNYAVLYRLQGRHDQAIDYLRQNSVGASHEAKELLILNLNLGNVFFDKKETDSAAYYYKHMEALLPTTKVKLETQLAAYDALYRFEKNQGNYSMALQYRGNHESLLYEIMQQRQEQSIYRIQQQYDYESLQNAMNKKIIYRHRIILIISILLFIAAIIILVLQFRHKQMMKAEKEMRQQIDNLKKELSQTVKPSYLEQELSSRLRLIISANRTQKQAYDPKKEWNPIVLRLMNGKESVFEAVMEEIEKVYPQINTVLHQKCPELNESEMKVCILSCSDLTNAEIADVLGLSLNTVNKNRSKVRNKLKLKPEKMKEQLHEVLVK